MKKIFTLALALLGFAGANAASVDDVQVCQHSYVLCFDDWDGAGTAKPGKGSLFGNDFFLDVTGGSVATNKGKVNLSVVNEADDNHVTQYIADKYGADYPDDHFNSWRLKNAQDVIAMKVTAKSKLIFFLQGNNKSGTAARIPKIATDAKLENALNEAPGEDYPTTDSGFRYEWIAPDDLTIYIGSYNGDTFFSYLIVEANEAPGTPTVKVGAQTYEGGLWFREVTCKANPATEEGSTEQIPTIVTYTTDGTMPTAASPVYTAPIKCYQNMTVKFQAFLDIDGGKANADFICNGADNAANVLFSFDKPSIEADGATFTITSPYADQNGTNFYKLNGGEEVQGNGATLTESATVTAFTKIVNGDYATFTSNSISKDVYVLNPIKEKKVIEVTAGDVVLDEEATATSTTGEVYTIENGEISADKMDFFVKNLTFKALKDEQYQVPAGNERYIQMSNTNITFMVAAGDEVNVKVICSKNACKNIDADDAEDGSAVNDRKCYVNVNGTNYCHLDAEGNEAADLKLYEDANIIEFTLKGGKDVTNKDEEGNEVTSFEAADTYYTFQKYSGTGNILISSIEIAPAVEEPVLADFEDGKYYLINVASEKAWGCGNSWGTQGSLVEHPEYVILHKQENGTYFMETQVSNGGESYYFGGEYMDGSPAALTIIQGEEFGEDEAGNPVYAYYVTVDGTNFYGWDGTESTVLARNLAAGDEKAQWMIASHEQALAGLAEATEENPMDATFLILDPNFGRNNRNQGAWTGDGFSVGGDNSNMNAEKWGGNSNTFDISQTVEAPNGKYVISWNGFYRYNNTTDNTNDIAIAAHADGTEVINSFVYINGTDYALTSIADETASAALEGKLPFSQGEASAAFGQGLYAKSAEVIVTDGKLTIGIKKIEHPGTDWTVWDNFELEYYGPASEPADPNELVINGDCEGADGGCLLSKNGDGDGSFMWNPVEGVGVNGSTCAAVHATGTAANEWDAQFFIFAKDHVFALGEKYKFTMWIKADKEANNSAQAHTTPGNYKHWRVISDGSAIHFSTEWTELTYEGEIDNDMVGIQTIAFNLNTDKALENNYYFDNISWKLVTEDGIETVLTTKVQNGAIYNLAGQKVDANYKGVVIKNGKKMLQK